MVYQRFIIKQEKQHGGDFIMNRNLILCISVAIMGFIITVPSMNKFLLSERITQGEIVTNDNPMMSQQDGDKREMVSFNLVGSYSVDTSGIREKEEIADGAPFTFFIQIRNVDDLKGYLIKEFCLDIPDINFNYPDKYMAISIGREVQELAYNGYLEEPYMPNTFAKAEITFAEQYHEQMLYVYAMDKVILTDSRLGLLNAGHVTRFYLMKDKERVFWGNTIHDINLY